MQLCRFWSLACLRCTDTSSLNSCCVCFYEVSKIVAGDSRQSTPGWLPFECHVVGSNKTIDHIFVGSRALFEIVSFCLGVCIGGSYVLMMAACDVWSQIRNTFSVLVRRFASCCRFLHSPLLCVFMLRGCACLSLSVFSRPKTSEFRTTPSLCGSHLPNCTNLSSCL